METLHEIFQIRFLLRNWKCYVKYFWNDYGKVFETIKTASRKHFEQRSKNLAVRFLELLHDNLLHPFQYYFLICFEKVFQIFLVLYKGIQKTFQEIFRQCFAYFARNISDKISDENLEMLREIFLKSFPKSFLRRSKRRVPNRSSNVSKTSQSDFGIIIRQFPASYPVLFPEKFWKDFLNFSSFIERYPKNILRNMPTTFYKLYTKYFRSFPVLFPEKFWKGLWDISSFV